MSLDKLTREAVAVCVERGMPFALFSLPGSDFFRFVASLPDDTPSIFNDSNKDCFFINFFDNEETYTATIPFAFDAQTLLQYIETEVNYNCIFSSPDIHPSQESTSHEEYGRSFAKVHASLNSDEEKIVLSRNRSIFTTKSILAIAEEYFSLSNTTFRYIAYTRQTGLWLASTPELLLKTISDSCIETMALAGTRSEASSEGWDEKNIAEHKIVVNYIEDVLSSHGLKVETGKMTDKRFINIVHLCTPIKAEGEFDVPSLLNALSPSPAVCGFPYEKAKNIIKEVEGHKRHCYGGYVGVRLDGIYNVFVNLRCLFIEPMSFNGREGFLTNIITGGGIMSESDEETEWHETEAKGLYLIRILEGRS